MARSTELNIFLRRASNPVQICSYAARASTSFQHVLSMVQVTTMAFLAIYRK
jgi:hypothetical protein